MINRLTRTYTLPDNGGVNEIEVQVFYDKGGVNMFSCTPKERGYYFSITPQRHVGCMYEYHAYDGAKCLMVPAKRQSKKLYEKAKQMFPVFLHKYLYSFCERNGYVLPDNYTEKEDDHVYSC